MKQVNITHAVRVSQNLLAVTHGVARSGRPNPVEKGYYWPVAKDVLLTYFGYSHLKLCPLVWFREVRVFHVLFCFLLSLLFPLKKHNASHICGQTYSSKKKVKKDIYKDTDFILHSSLIWGFYVVHFWAFLTFLGNVGDHCSYKSDLPKFARVNRKAVQTQQKHNKTSLIWDCFGIHRPRTAASVWVMLPGAAW